MNKPKIYLSKSKAGSMDSLMNVRDLLAQYDIELLEFSGGEYSDKLLKSSDHLLVLPPKLPKAFNYDFTLGKEQFTEFETVKGLKSIHFIICIGDELYVSTIEDYDIIEEDWKTKYAHIWCVEQLKPLHQIINIPFKKEIEKYSNIKPMLACFNLNK